MQLRSATSGQVPRDSANGLRPSPSTALRQGQVRHPHQIATANAKQAPAGVRASSPPLASNDARSQMLGQSKKPSPALNSARGKVGYLAQYQGNDAPHPNDLHQASAPSEAPSSAARSNSQRGLSSADVERMSAEDRIRRLENSLNERLIRSSSEAMNASLTLCKAAEDRLMQKMDSFRREIQKELAQALHAMERNAEKSHVFSNGLDAQRLKDELTQELQEALGQEFAHLRLELAARGVPVMAGLPATGEMDSVGAQSQSKKTGIAGLVGVISDCVVEKVKEDQSIRIASDQHQQLKEVIKELREIPIGKPEMHAELDGLRNMVKESLNISYALVKELSADRGHKDVDLTAATQRLKEVMGQDKANSRPRSASLTRPSQPIAASNARSPSIESSSSLDRVVGGLQRLVHPQDEARLTPRSSSRSGSANQSRSGSVDDHDFGTEVKALRARLENIFHVSTVNSASESESVCTGSTGYSGTVGPLPTVQESAS